MKNIFTAFFYFSISLALSFFVFYSLHSPYVTMIMLLPVFIITSFLGARYGYVTTFLSVIAIYFFFPAEESISFIRIATYLGLAITSIIFISKRRVADDAIKESEKQFRQLADSTPVLIWMSGADKLCYYFNNSWLEFTGRTMEQELGNGWADGVHPDDLQRCLDVYISSFDARKPFSMEYRLRHKSKEYHWILDNGTPRFDKNGEFLGYIGSCTDITEIKEFADKIEMEQASKKATEELLRLAREAEEEVQAVNEELEASFATLEAERDKIQLIVDELPNIIIIKNQELRYVFMNRALSLFLGKPEEELFGKTVFDILPQDEAQQIWNDEVKILEYGTEKMVEETVTNAEGVRTLFSVKKSIGMGDGTTGLLVVITDITEHKAMTETLREVENTYSSLFDNMLNGFAYCRMIYDTDGNPADFVYESVNTAFELQTGLKNVVGRKISDVVPNILKEDRELIELYGRVSTTGISEHTEVYVKALNSWFSISVYSPKYGYFVAIFDVITERKTMEIALKESEEKFRAIFEKSYDALMLSDGGQFIDCNQRALELFGMTDKAEFITYSPVDLSPTLQPNGEDSYTAAMRQIKIAMEKGSNHFEWNHTRKNGEAFPADILLTAFDYHGKRIIQATVRDITERREAKLTSALLEKFFDNTNEGMTIADKNGLIVSVNPAFSRITGYTLEDVRGQNPRILQSGEYSQEFYERMWRDILENGRWEGEIRNKRKNGETYPEWLTITPIYNDNKEIDYFVAVFLDLTQAKEKQYKIDEQAHMIVAQSRFAAMGEMIGMIAHQWRQPITAIGMSANNMILDIDMGEIKAEIFRKHLESIGSQVQFLSHTIDDFRNFFKPQTNSSIVSIHTLIDKALRIIGKSLESHNIAVKTDTACKELCSVENCSLDVVVYEGEIVQALLVFLGNAKDALTDKNIENPIITIGCASNANDEFAEISVCDNAGGVPDEIMLKIFEPYFTTKAAKNGTGLGLYIAKTIVEKYQGGSIGLNNTKEGACFWIRLPLAKQDTVSG